MKSAVILAAGQGKGAWPFCGIRQKVTVPVANVPIVRRLVLDVQRSGINDIVVVLGHRAEAVRACTADIEGIRFVEQRQLKGPADAALTGVLAVEGDEVLVCHADAVTSQESIMGFVAAWDALKGEPCLMTAPCPRDTPHYISIDCDNDGLVRVILGHGDRGLPRFAGFAAAKTERMHKYLVRNPGIMDRVPLGAMPPVEGEVPHSFELMRQDGIEVHAISVQDFFVDVDRPWHILEANHHMAKHYFDTLESTVIEDGASVDDGADIESGAKLYLAAGASIGKGCHIRGSLYLGPRSCVSNGAIMHDGILVGSDTVCRDYCTVAGGSVLGNGCLFAHGSEFEGVTLDTVWLYHYCCITGLIGMNVDIGAATVCGTWRFDDGVRQQIVKGHKEFPERFSDCTFIGDYCRTGVNVMFMPGVKVGWHSCIGAGAILYEDVPEETLLLPKQEHVQKKWGPERYGW